MHAPFDYSFGISVYSALVRGIDDVVWYVRAGDSRKALFAGEVSGELLNLWERERGRGRSEGSGDGDGIGNGSGDGIGIGIGIGIGNAK